MCADPFHIIQLANAAVDEVRRAAWNSTRRAAGVTRPGPLARVRQDPAAQLVKHTRWALLKDPAGWTDQQRQTITRLRRARHVLFRAWVLKEELRDLYRLPPGSRPDAHLDAWLARASRCRIPAMVDLSRTIRRHRDQILVQARRSSAYVACRTAACSLLVRWMCMQSLLWPATSAGKGARLTPEFDSC